MPSIRYINQSAPFWDFVASFENEASSHPLFNQGGSERRHGPEAFGPWAWGLGAHPGRQHGAQQFYQRGGGPESTAPQGGRPATNNQGPSDTANAEQRSEKEPLHENTDSTPKDDANPPPYRRGCGARRAGHCGEFRRRQCGGGRPGAFPMGGPFGFGAQVADFLNAHINGESREDPAAGTTTTSDDFKPEADVFDTEAAFIVHVSLPGANKEDVGVNWDAEKSELSIAGVSYRPGDEDLLKTLALDERKVGPFEKKVRLGTRANPAQVDIDGITAKLEDGILKVEVPKLDKDYVEIRKVDIE